MTAPTPVIENRKARFQYFVEEQFEVGIVLTGTEVKSIRQSKVNFADSYIEISDSMELFLVNAHIDEYTEGNRFNHTPKRKRKLLAHTHEILKMHKAHEIKGYTLIPLKMYFHNRKVKLKVGICKGKDAADKRQTIKERDAKKSVAQAMRQAMK
jgi:SsrA-binding protein